MQKTLWSSPRYKKFTEDRNKALEQINNNCQTDISRMLFEALDRITGFVSHSALQKQVNLAHATFLVNQLSAFIDSQFTTLIDKISQRIIRMRQATFTITYLAELEAIARATQKTKSMNQIDFKQKVKHQVAKNTLAGQPMSHRIWLGLTNIKRNIIKAYQLGIVFEETPLDIVNRVKSVYPKVEIYKIPPRILKIIREAKKPFTGSSSDEDDELYEFNFYSDIVSDAEWTNAVQAYKETELPPSRFDNIPGFDSETYTMRYNWEVEQEVTDDFVQQVRDGQIDAATEMGVKDFVWVAIIDNKTCEECCLPRNGLTLSEIKSKLSSGAIDKNDCDAATSPPAHFNCRCDIAPVSKTTNDVQGPDWASFADWLDSE